MNKSELKKSLYDLPLPLFYEIAYAHFDGRLEEIIMEQMDEMHGWVNKIEKPISEEKMNHFAIFYGMGVLFYIMLKSIFYPSTLLYRCPECNLCIRKNDEKCFRCGISLDWDN